MVRTSAIISILLIFLHFRATFAYRLLFEAKFRFQNESMSQREYALSILRRQGISVSSIADRLAVMFIFNYIIEFPLTSFLHRRLNYLHCSMNLLHEYLQIHSPTPFDVYLWINADTIEHLPSWLLDSFPNLIIIPILSSTWKIPEEAGNPSNWVGASTFSIDWYLMCRWKMTYQLEFGSKVGYQYLLMLDDDTFIHHAHSTFPEGNLVEYFRTHQIKHGVRRRRFRDDPYLKGFWEFTQLWMLTRNFSKPIGSLMENLEVVRHLGDHSTSLIPHQSRRWNSIVYQSNFMIWDLEEWWKNDLLQDYVQFVLHSGMDISQRWIEQVSLFIYYIYFYCYYY